MASLAEQTVARMGGPASVLTRQKADHVELDRLLQRLGEVSPAAQGPVLRDIYRLVFPHAFAEEAVLWPVMRRVLPDGHELTLRVEREHQAINELVARLEGLVPGTSEHRQVLTRTVRLLREDVRDEEDLLLPRLQEKLTDRQLRLLGFAWDAVRRIAPTRAHPIVARRPPGNVLSALPLSVLDRSRDTVEAMIDRRAASAPLLRRIGAALATTSRGVEYLPGMGSGEDRSTRSARRSRHGWMIGAAGAIGAVLVVRSMRQARRRQRA